MNLLISELQAGYRSGALELRSVLRSVLAATQAAPQDIAWILRFDQTTVDEQVQDLVRCFEASGHDWRRFPLYGVPFVIKDNIDFGGQPTTAACPEFAFTPKRHAHVVQRLIEAGAICVGKTNLDQFATGLNGTRSPYGAVPNAFNPAYVSGGSSSGSASVVARGLVSFALGTDTAGSGRVPAGFNNIVGLKPTKGALSTRGVVPACRSLDVVSIFALTTQDAAAVYEAAAGFDAEDIYSRRPGAQAAVLPAKLRIGVPERPSFCGDHEAEKAFNAAVERAVAQGASIVRIDLTPFLEAAALLYGGPWVAERYAAIETMFESKPEAIHPVVRDVIAKAREFSSVDAFKAVYRLETLRRATEPVWNDIDAMLVPTSPTIYTIEAMLADPVKKNSDFGLYTNFVNLLDLSAIAVPVAMRADGLPTGVTLIAPSWSDRALCEWGGRWQRDTGLPLGATGWSLPSPERNGPENGSRSASSSSGPAAGMVRVGVVGAHLSGMPLNFQLVSREARLVAATHTSASYRLYALANTTPPKPGLARVAAGQGASIAVELWDMPLNRFGEFVAEIPAPLGIGSLELITGETVKGFICEAAGLEGAEDVTAFGGWKRYLASRHA